MPKVQKIIQSFNAGELSPLMDARIDQEKYKFGCRTMENFFPLIYGGAERRPGTEYIAAQKTQSAKGRLVAFEHSVDDTYVLLFENQAIRFFKSGAAVTGGMGTEDLSSIGSVVAHWKMNDDAASQPVVDDHGATHDGSASIQTNLMSVTGKVNDALDFNGDRYATVTDSGLLTFIDDAGTPEPFSIAAWVKVDSDVPDQSILTKWKSGAANLREWQFEIAATGQLSLAFRDEANTTTVIRRADNPMTSGWHLVVSTYPGTGGANAPDDIILYIDGSAVAATSTGGGGSYSKMANTATNVLIGAQYDNSGAEEKFFQSRMDNVAIFGKELTADNVTTLWNSTTFEIVTPYLTADLFGLKFETSADVMFISHPDYETRKLSRFADDRWELVVANITTGPFRDQNTDLDKTITATEISGGGILAGASVTLSASGHLPFVTGTTAGHSPSGLKDTSKSQTGALFQLIHASTNDSVASDFAAPGLSSELAVSKGITWDFVTNGSWTGTVKLQREYNNSGIWETVHTVTSASNKNIETSGTEDFNEAKYRMEATALSVATAECQLSIRDTSHVGIVKITSVTDSATAIGTVIKDLVTDTAGGGTFTDPTHRWAEGSFSNYRGWPIDVAISSEERLTFAGNITEPLTIWGSVVGDFTDFTLGADDDAAIQFTLVGSGQQNRIRWMVAKEALVLGTVGGEHLLGASKDEEALTPSNVKAKLQTTYGSENVAAKIVNQAILFVQRGGRKIREFLYNFEADAHKADDLTVFANHITESGIVDMAFQRTPDPILWGIRGDGQLATLSYERDQNVFAWARQVIGGTDVVVESAAVTYGGAGNEDEVWISVARTIDGGTKRYIERFKPRDWGSTLADAFFVDSGITDTGATTTVSGLDHLEGEVVQVFADGLLQTEATTDDFKVTGGDITVAAGLTTVQVGLGYTSTLKPMKLDISQLGLGVTKRINRGIVSFFNTIGGEIGRDASNTHPFELSGWTALFTGDKEISFPGTYQRTGDVVILQSNALPMTITAITVDVGVSND